MSEQKVDRYKHKKNMRAAAEKEAKLKSLLSRVFVAVFCLAFVFWLGYSIYLSVHGPIKSRTTVNAEAVTDYLTTLNETEVSVDETTEDTAEQTDETADQTDETSETEDQSETEEVTTTESQSE